ncbi:MAG: hypothetical protein IE913_11260, partial [Halothiobacillus sp.]|nr:hypothetical protein [Halothiobacillus sp.]
MFLINKQFIRQVAKFCQTMRLNVRLKLVASGREITQALNAGEAQLGGANMGTTTASARASG